MRVKNKIVQFNVAEVDREIVRLNQSGWEVLQVIVVDGCSVSLLIKKDIH